MSGGSCIIGASINVAYFPVQFARTHCTKLHHILFLFRHLDNCGGALGLESGRITNSAITASSSYDAGNVGPQFAR